MPAAREYVTLLTAEERRTLTATFDYFDRDKSSYLCRNELIMVLHELEIFDTTDCERRCVDEWFDKIDKDKDSRIHKEEFLAMMSEGMKLDLTEEDLRGAFSVFDADGSGTVDAEELKFALSGLGPMVLSTTECEELMELLDTNHSGTLEVQEFLAAFLKNEKNPLRRELCLTPSPMRLPGPPTTKLYPTKPSSPTNVRSAWPSAPVGPTTRAAMVAPTVPSDVRHDFSYIAVST